jgi:hypothetical protein
LSRRRSTDRLDLRPDEPPVRDADIKPRRLGDDRGVGGHVAHERLGADALCLLVDDRRHDHIPGEAEPPGVRGREHRRRKAGLHVVGAAAVQPDAVDPRRVRSFHA